MDLKSEKAKALTKKQVFEELRSYLNEQVDISNRKCMDEENFKLPAFFLNVHLFTSAPLNLCLSL